MTILGRSGTWTKSSYSANTDSCVEVVAGKTVGVRDTKDRAGGQLAVRSPAWAALLATVKDDAPRS